MKTILRVLSIGLLLAPTAHSNQTAASLVGPISLLLDQCNYQQNVVSINGLTADPETEIANAGKNSTVQIDSTFGALSPVNQIVMNECQMLLGIGASSPIIQGSIKVAPGGIIDNLTVNGQGDAPALELDGNGTFEILDSLVTNVDSVMTYLLTLPGGSNRDFSSAGIIAVGNNPRIHLNNVDATLTGMAVELWTNGGSAVVDGGQFTTTGSGDFLNFQIRGSGSFNLLVNGATIESQDNGFVNLQTRENASLDVSIINTSIVATDIAVNNMQADDNSKITAEIMGVDFTSTGDSNVLNNFQSNDFSTLNLNISDSDFHATTLSGGFNNFQANDNSVYTAVISGNTTVSSNESAAFNSARSNDEAQMSLTISDSAFSSNGNHGAQAITSAHNSNFTLAISTSKFTGGTNSSGISQLESRNNSSISAEIYENDITGDQGALGSNALTNSTLCVDFKDNTMTSGATFADFGLTQSDSGIFQVVDFSSIEADNNGASVKTAGSITDVANCP